MKLIPSVIMASTTSRAERTVFDLLAKVELGHHAVAFHSVNLREHEYKVSGEIDFAILSPRGLIVLEVKGGAVACDEDGRWRFVDRYGAAHRSSEGPFRQAESAMHALRTRLMSDLDVSPLRFGFAVAFPETTFNIASVSWDPELVVDGPQLRGGADALATAIRSVYRYWEARLPQRSNAGPEILDAVRSRLRPRFELVPSIALQADALERRMEALTEAQYRFIDIASDNRRIVCYGGAGTGKTFLLAELARRLTAVGDKVIVTCQSPVFASYLRGRLPKSVRTIVFHELAAAVVSKDFVQAEVLLVDEAQDLINLESLEVLDAAVRGGIDHGRWRVFLDENLQSSLHGNLDRDALELLASSSTSLRLPENCRNTTHIGLQTMLLTGGDIGQPLAGEGPPVEYRYFGTENDQIWQLRRVISELVEDGAALGEITIVSSRPFELSVASALTGNLAPTPLPETIAAAFPPTTITFANPADIKGLENRYVVVADLFSAPTDLTSIAELYVGMTRARVGLFLLVSRGAKPAFEVLMKTNLKKLRKVEAPRHD